MHKPDERVASELSDEELDLVAGGAWYGEGQLSRNSDPDRVGPGTEQ
jgi:hypothetical protein